MFKEHKKYGRLKFIQNRKEEQQEQQKKRERKNCKTNKNKQTK